MLYDIKNDCLQYAGFLGDYQAMSCDDLATNYCKMIDNKDDFGQSTYLAALVLRFWYTIDKMYQKCPGLGLAREDFYDWLVEAINYACKYRAWLDPEKKVNAQQAINKCINTIRLQHYYEFNLDKHKANYNNVDLETPFKDDERGNSLLDTLFDDTSVQDRSKLEAELLVQSYINDKKIIEAIILDTIAFTNVEKHTKEVSKEFDENGKMIKHTKNFLQFWPYRLVQTLGNLPVEYPKYFTRKYSIVGAELEASLQAIRSANNQKLYKYLDACLASLKTKLNYSK